MAKLVITANTKPSEVLREAARRLLLARNYESYGCIAIEDVAFEGYYESDLGPSYTARGCLEESAKGYYMETWPEEDPEDLDYPFGDADGGTSRELREHKAMCLLLAAELAEDDNQ